MHNKPKELSAKFFYGSVIVSIFAVLGLVFGVIALALSLGLFSVGGDDTAAVKDATSTSSLLLDRTGSNLIVVSEYNKEALKMKPSLEREQLLSAIRDSIETSTGSDRVEVGDEALSRIENAYIKALEVEAEEYLIMTVQPVNE